MKKYMLLQLLIGVGYMYGMLPERTKKNSKPTYVESVEVHQSRPPRVFIIKRRNSLIEKEKFIEERRLLWEYNLKDVYQEMVSDERVQNLITQFAERDWECHNLYNTCETQPKKERNNKSLLH